MELSRVGCDTALATLRLTKSLVERHGPRIAGTRQCLNAASQIAEMMRIHCDRVVEERFEMHPGSFWKVGKIMVVAYLLSVFFLLAGGLFTYLSLAFASAGLGYGIVLYIFNGTWFDRWFAGVEGCNVSGVIEPSDEVKRQVVLSGHHDSAYVVSFLLGRKELARVRLVLAILVYTATLLTAVAAVAREISGRGDPLPAAFIIVVAALGVIFVVPLYSVITRLQSPGAGDNLNSTAMAVTAGVHFDLQRKKGMPLKHTRVVLLSTDGEEVGMRGAIEYCRRHKEDLLAIPTFVFNMDSIYSADDITILTRDRNGTRKLSQQMATECRDTAVALGYFPGITPMPPTGGGTDAAAFAKVGIEAASIIGIPVRGINEGMVYHTPQDTVEHIDPKAVEAVLDIAINYIVRKDRESE